MHTNSNLSFIDSVKFNVRFVLFKVKELGVLITNCSCLVDDLQKIFNVYWDMGKKNAVIPPSWPKSYATRINATNPVPISFNGDYKLNTYFSVGFYAYHGII